MHREAGGGWYHLNSHFSHFINVCFHLMNARSPSSSNLAVDLYACSAAFRQISLLYYTLLHLILINCGTGCIRRLGNYLQSINLVQNTHWILQHVKSCSMWFRQSISCIQRFRVTAIRWLSLTQTDRLSLMPQLSYHVCDLGLTALPLRVIFILGQIRMTGKWLFVRLGTVF